MQAGRNVWLHLLQPDGFLEQTWSANFLGMEEVGKGVDSIQDRCIDAGLDRRLKMGKMRLRCALKDPLIIA